MSASGSSYSSVEYWNTRYEKSAVDAYDWYLGYDLFRPHLYRLCSELGTAPDVAKQTFKILIVGCGNSPLSAEMHRDGFQHVVSIDYSPVVIRKMSAQHPHLTFLEADVRDMKFEDREFDLVVDKGTLDAILCGSDSGKNSTAMLTECERVLKDTGALVVVTYGSPDSRLHYLQARRYGWTVSHQGIADTRFIYSMTKKKK